MQMIIAVIKPNKVDAVKGALTKIGVLGMTAMESKGYGKQMGHSERYRGPKLDVGFVPKVCLFVCVTDADKEQAMKSIVESSRSGNVGDGKIFVLPLAEALRIRTGEFGDAAL
jgi:nitrogen regulatory protein PII